MSSDAESPNTEKETIEDVILLLRLFNKQYGSSKAGVKVLKNRLLAVKCRSTWESFLRSAGKRMLRNEDLLHDSPLSNHLIKKRKFKSSISVPDVEALQQADKKLQDILRVSSSTEPLKVLEDNIASCSKEAVEVSLLSEDDLNSPQSLTGDLSDAEDKDMDSSFGKYNPRHLLNSTRPLKKVTAFKSIKRNINQEDHLLLEEVSRVEHNRRVNREIIKAKNHHARSANGIHLNVSKIGVPSAKEESDHKMTAPSMKKVMKAKKSFPSSQTFKQQINSGTKVPNLEGPLVSGTARKSTGSYSTKVVNL